MSDPSGYFDDRCVRLHDRSEEASCCVESEGYRELFQLSVYVYHGVDVRGWAFGEVELNYPPN